MRADFNWGFFPLQDCSCYKARLLRMILELLSSCEARFEICYYGFLCYLKHNRGRFRKYRIEITLAPRPCTARARMWKMLEQGALQREDVWANGLDHNYLFHDRVNVMLFWGRWENRKACAESSRCMGGAGLGIKTQRYFVKTKIWERRRASITKGFALCEF